MEYLEANRNLFAVHIGEIYHKVVQCCSFLRFGSISEQKDYLERDQGMKQQLTLNIKIQEAY